MPIEIDDTNIIINDGSTTSNILEVVKSKGSYNDEYYQTIEYDAQWTYSDTDASVYHLGNVGIGTEANSVYSLNVAGDVNVNGDLYYNNAKANVGLLSNYVYTNEEPSITPNYDYIEEITGMSGWTKIKHRPANDGTWFAGDTFNSTTINSSYTYGSPTNDNSQWAVAFDHTKVKYYLFIERTGLIHPDYYDRWFVFTADNMDNYSNYPDWIPAYKATGYPNGFSNALQYNRGGTHTYDPNIGLGFPHTKISDGSTTTTLYTTNRAIYLEASTINWNGPPPTITEVYVKYTDDIPLTTPQPQIPTDKYKYHILTFEGSSGYTSTTDGNQRTYNIDFPEDAVADILIVGGGGGGGSYGGGNYECGGGGAGAFQYINNVKLNGNYNFIIGNGGSPSGKGYSSEIKSFNNILFSCEGGGAGGGTYGIINSNNNGGSGGGGQWGYNNFGIANDPLKGFNGARGTTNSGANEGGGGGGAGGSGILKFGGIGKKCDILGNDNYYAGGGGGCSSGSIGGDGGLGGGGKGSASSLQAENGLNGTGSGGGGGYLIGNKPGGRGGSGIVIIRYYYVSSITHKYLAFTSPTTYTLNVPENTTCDILIVGGGGGGGSDCGGGGGGGGVIYAKNVPIPANTYTIKVGKGGTSMSSGNTSEAFGAIAKGGGGGGGGIRFGNTNATSGGSGGGGGLTEYIVPRFRQGGGIGTNTIGTILNNGNVYNYNGNIGGNCPGRNTYPYALAGGGGGANQVGVDGIDGSYTGVSNTNNNGKGKGGDGIDIDITGNVLYWGAGGGGGSLDAILPGYGGRGGGGGGGQGFDSVDTPLTTYGGLGGVDGYSSPIAPTNTAIAETGNGGHAGAGTGSGGGGGGYYYNKAGGNGGSGIVIIRYSLGNKIYKLSNWEYSSRFDDVYYMGSVAIGKDNASYAVDLDGLPEASSFNIINVNGTITSSSKNFKIEHPIVSNMYLYHGCIEGPRFDNMYRGKKLVVGGYCEVDIDTECNNTGGMTPGTFVALNGDSQLYLQNNQTFDKVRGYIENGKIKIFCINTTKNIMVDWLVIGERHDKDVINTTITNTSGKLICEQ